MNMTFIYDKETFKIQKQFETMRGAKIGFTRMKFDPAKYGVLSHEDFDAIDPIVERVNLISGKTFLIKASQADGCCDPSTETYWSM